MEKTIGLSKQEMRKQRKSYVVLLTDDTKNAKLNKSEWAYVERLFTKHSGLCSIEAVDRMYPPEIR